jgi:chemotaxis protein CheX
MRAEFVNPFVQAAFEVLESEVGGTLERGAVRVERSAYTADDITALVGVVGERIRGLVMYAMNTRTALRLVSTMMGQPFSDFNVLAKSGIGELSNVITGKAATLLADSGFSSMLAPPTLIVGKGTLITTLDQQRLVVGIVTDHGPITVHIALNETPVATAQLAAAGTLAARGR